MRVLITGAAGFIGFHVAKKLSEQGHFVIGIDNFSSYYPISLKRDREKVLLGSCVQILEQDLRDTEQLKELLGKEKITHVVHLAAQAGVRYSLEEPKSYLQSNIDGFLSLLEALRHYPDIVTAWASSSSVYGSNQKVPFAESDSTDSPTNLYGATKKANEVMAHAYHHLFGLKLIGLRFFTVYGPWGRPDMAYFLFAEKIMKGETLSLFGKGRRDFTYVDDIVDGICSALSAPQSYGLYNLGNSHPETVARLVSCLELSLGRKATIEYSEAQAGDMDETWAEIDQAKRELGFSPKISLSVGIDRFAKWFTSYYSNV